MTVLFQDGDWRLIAGGFSSELQHHCVQPNTGNLWWYYAYDGECGVCHKEIPDPILGLRNLHRWER